MEDFQLSDECLAAMEAGKDKPADWSKVVVRPKMFHTEWRRLPMTTPETVEAYTSRIVAEWRDGPGFPHLGDHENAIPAVRSLVHRVLEDAVNGRVILPVQLRIVGGLSMPSHSASPSPAPPS